MERSILIPLTVGEVIQHCCNMMIGTITDILIPLTVGEVIQPGNPMAARAGTKS